MGAQHLPSNQPCLCDRSHPFDNDLLCMLTTTKYTATPQHHARATSPSQPAFPLPLPLPLPCTPHISLSTSFPPAPSFLHLPL